MGQWGWRNGVVCGAKHVVFAGSQVGTRGGLGRVGNMSGSPFSRGPLVPHGGWSTGGSGRKQGDQQVSYRTSPG